MVEKNSKRTLVVYESGPTQIRSIEEAREATAFLHKAFSLGMFNKILYTSNGGGGFHQDVNSKNLDWVLDQILVQAKGGNLPSRYSVGMNASYDGTCLDPKVYEKED